VLNNSYLAEHLTNDDLNVLVVDRYTLRAVNALDATNEVLLHGANALYSQNFLGVNGSNLELLTEFNVVTIRNEESRTLEHGVDNCLVTIVWCEDYLTALVGLFDGDTTSSLSDWRCTLRGTCFEELLNTRQTLCDVISRCGTPVWKVRMVS
jgi:hypothetical protein